MRIRYLLMVFLLLSFTNTFAQLDIGAYSGLGLGKFKGDQAGDGKYNKLISANYGLIFDLTLSDQLILSLQPGLSGKGTRISYSVKGEPEPVDSIAIKINYFSIPLLIKISSKNEHFYAIGGLEAGLPLSATAEFIAKLDDKRDVLNHLSDINLVMHFGVGYRIPVGKPTLFIEARYLQGLNNAVPLERPEYNYFPRVRTSDIQLLFGIEFSLF
ncbi:MAG: outer membrane beta-barrel protein [Draconibacterium sp.]|nr:outer membrane beta-barrel protein [Draconibacterium sp.]